MEILPFRLAMPIRLGLVNCYLLILENGFILIDTGCSNRRQELVRGLESAGCKPGNLKLIVLTHGDFDHTGNAAFLHQKYAAPTGAHPGDLGMFEQGDMFYNRQNANPLMRFLVPRLIGYGRRERFKPDVFFTGGESLSAYGCPAEVVHLPGHSAGSIGVKTADGDLFCGDLLDNTQTPALSSLMDNLQLGKASLISLSRLNLRTIYPGHGEPFAMKDLC